MKRSLAIALTFVFVLSISTAVYANNNALNWAAEEVASGAVPPHIGYMADWNDFYHVVEKPTSPDQIYRSLAELLVEEGHANWSEMAGLSDAEVKELALIRGVTYYFTELESLTNQVWAVQVEANPGESGTLSQSFEAAYGPWADSHYFPYYHGDPEEPDLGWWFVDKEGDQWPNYSDEDYFVGVDMGNYYVGNYFHIDQLAGTSGGTTKRYISVSSPWSGAFVEEDMSVVGRAEIVDNFRMDNLEAGAAVVPDWWDVF